MSLLTWLQTQKRNWGRRPTNRPAKARRHNCRPRLERLEDRLAPALITITTLADESAVDGQVSLREAIQAAETHTSVDGSVAGTGDDTIVFAPAIAGGIEDLTQVGDTSFGPSALAITGDITIAGSGQTLSRDSAAAPFRLFLVSGGANLTLENLTLANGLAEGGNGGGAEAQIGGGGGGAAGMGGGVFNQGMLTLAGVTLTGNTAQGGRGGLPLTGGSGISGGEGGGGVGGPGQDDFGSIGGNGGIPNPGAGAIPGVKAAGNGGDGGGGGGNGVLSQGAPGNGAFGGGGGGDTTETPDIVLPGGSGGFGGGGGGLAGFSGAPGGFGGGSGEALSAGGAGGGGAGMGGGIFNRGGTLSITNSTLEANKAFGGGAVSPGTGLGGGLFNLDGTVTVTNSTFAGNVVGNGALPDGAALYSLQQSGTATLSLTNTILANSTGGKDAVNNGGTVSGSHNLVMTSSGLPTAVIVSSADPMLGPLADNGGPTRTMALLQGSPAIDAGDNSVTVPPLNLTTDQRGLPRLVGAAVDIGAFEVQSTPTTTVLTSDHASGSIYGQAVTFTATVSAATGTPTGSVQFQIDGSNFGAPVTLSGGSAFIDTATLPAASHSIVAFYTSDSSAFGNSDDSAEPLSQSVAPAPLTITADNQTEVYGATLPPLTYTPSGFVNGDTAAVLSGSPALAADAAQYSAPGGYVITVSQGSLADPDYAFQFVNGTLTVNKAFTGTALTVSAFTPLAGVDAVTLTAAVTVIAPGSGSLTGTVDFFDVTTSMDLGSAVLVSGGATLDAGPLAAGGHAITATYSGDGDFVSSSGTASLTALAPASLSGVVFADFNDDGQIDFGEHGIGGVSVHLTGADDLGHAVDRTLQTDGDGAFLFLDLRPGSYYLTRTTQPDGYTPGIDSVGTAGGSLSTTVSDQFFVQLGQGVNGLNYNYGELPASTGPVQKGQTATIGFWNNKNGQALILALNGGGASHELGDWLAATFGNLYGANSGDNLAGRSNAAVAALFQQDFLLKGVKLDAQVLATALAVYVTNASLDPTQAAAGYGFTVSGDGVGTATFNVGSNGDAFGAADDTTLTVMDLLLDADAQAVNGVLYHGNTTRRTEANSVFSALNQAGDIN